MTPNDIEILLHYHVSPAEHPRIDAPAVCSAINLFVCEDIFTEIESVRLGDATFALTDRGVALVKLLCRTKFPVATWADEHGVPV